MDISLKLEWTFIHFVNTGNGVAGYLVVLYEENRPLVSSSAAVRCIVGRTRPGSFGFEPNSSSTCESSIKLFQISYMEALGMKKPGLIHFSISAQKSIFCFGYFFQTWFWLHLLQTRASCNSKRGQASEVKFKLWYAALIRQKRKYSRRQINYIGTCAIKKVENEPFMCHI